MCVVAGRVGGGHVAGFSIGSHLHFASFLYIYSLKVVRVTRVVLLSYKGSVRNQRWKSTMGRLENLLMGTDRPLFVCVYIYIYI